MVLISVFFCMFVEMEQFLPLFPYIEPVTDSLSMPYTLIITLQMGAMKRLIFAWDHFIFGGIVKKK